MDKYIFIALILLIILFLTVLIFCIVNTKKLNELNEYAEDGDLAGTLKKYYKKTNEMRVMIHDASDKKLESRIAACENKIVGCYSKMYVINFDAFDDVTGKLSFSLALLDLMNNGIILTSLYGHSSCNTYIRTITNGTAAVKLTDEERLALNKAMMGEKKEN